VQVLYSEGVANRTGPEPCAGAREGGGEASAGERAAPDLIRGAKVRTPERRRRYQGGRPHGPLRQRERRPGSAWSKTPACTDAPRAGTGRSAVCPAA
jgi:hypothetical protein